MSKITSAPTTVPFDSLIFGYLPMVPFVLGALGCWFVPSVHNAAIALTIIWGSLIIAFVGGVRRGFGFGDRTASLASTLWTMTLYVTIGGGALILAWASLEPTAVALLTLGYILVPILDHYAARAGDAPAHFAMFRPIQMPIAVLALATILVRLLVG